MRAWSKRERIAEHHIREHSFVEYSLMSGGRFKLTNEGDLLEGLCYAGIEDPACGGLLVHGASGIHSA